MDVSVPAGATALTFYWNLYISASPTVGFDGQGSSVTIQPGERKSLVSAPYVMPNGGGARLTLRTGSGNFAAGVKWVVHDQVTIEKSSVARAGFDGSATPDADLRPSGQAQRTPVRVSCWAFRSQA